MTSSSPASADRIEGEGRRSAVADYAKGDSRLHSVEKDPLGFDTFFQQFASPDGLDLALTLRGFQARRPSLLDQGSELATISAPVLLMLGDRDSGCVEPTLFMWRTIPGATLAELPNTGHCINLEEHRVFNHLLLDFLDRVAAAAGQAA